jgi:GTPase KRas protein
MEKPGTENKIVVLGGGGVGKSALTIRLVTDNFLEEYDPTIEDSYRKQVNIDGTVALLDILDTAGQEEFASMQDQWIREGKGFLLVYTITSQQSFEEMRNFHKSILRTKDADKVPLVIAGNKCDLRDPNDGNQVPKSQGEELAKEWGCPFFETSAKDKINNEECFYEVVREIRKADEEIVKPPGVDGCGGGCCSIL